MQPTSENIRAVGEELFADAKGVSNSAADRVHSEVDARKGDLAASVKSVSGAIERAADGLDQNTPSWVKSAFAQGAQQIQKLADTLEHKDSRQIASEVGAFARNSPVTFLASCAAAGFAAARIFKAGSSSNVLPGSQVRSAPQATDGLATDPSGMSTFSANTAPGQHP